MGKLYVCIPIERKDYVINGKLVSSREINEDIVIDDITQESVSVTPKLDTSD